MPNVNPMDLVVRCYAHRTGKGNWFGLCIDFNIGAEADTPEELKSKMGEFIESYLETVFDTEDPDSIPYLLRRRSSLRHRAVYYGIRLLHFIRDLPNRFTFERFIPLCFPAQR